MELGQRIAQKRKELGLSQEALGEELGVSRQAIYKWESGSALPEIEKLIQLSARFGVSVGWLLGVEDAPAAEPESGELTEQQLHMVEEIVGRYLEAKPKMSRRRRRICAVLALAVLCVGINLFSRLERLDERYDALQDAVNRVASTVGSEIGSISWQVEEVLKEQNRLTAEYGAERKEMDPAGGSVDFSVYAVPKTFVEGMYAEFVAESGGEPTVLTCADAPQQRFSGVLHCPLTDEIKLSVVFVHPDGKRETQLLETYYGLLSDTYPQLWVENFHLHGQPVQEGEVTLRDFYIGVTEKDAIGSTGAAAVEIRPGLFLNRKLIAWAEPCEIPSGWRGFEDYLFYSVPDVTLSLTQEDRLYVAALVTDSIGRQFMQYDIPYGVQYEGGPVLSYVGDKDLPARDISLWDFSAD